MTTTTATAPAVLTADTIPAALAIPEGWEQLPPDTTSVSMGDLVVTEFGDDVSPWWQAGVIEQMGGGAREDSVLVGNLDMVGGTRSEATAGVVFIAPGLARIYGKDIRRWAFRRA